MRAWYRPGKVFAASSPAGPRCGQNTGGNAMRHGRYLCVPSAKISRLFFWLFLVFFLTTGTAQAQAVQAQGAQAQAAQAQALTQALVSLNARYRALGPGAGEHLLAQFLYLAAERRELLAVLIAAAPDEALTTALPVQLTRFMPAEVQSFIEQWQEVEGEVEVLFVDHDPGLQSARRRGLGRGPAIGRSPRSRGDGHP